MAGLLAERIEQLINFRLIEPGFDGTAKLNEFYRSPTLSIFLKKPKGKKEDAIKSTEQSPLDKQPAKDDS